MHWSNQTLSDQHENVKETRRRTDIFCIFILTNESSDFRSTAHNYKFIIRVELMQQSVF